MYTMSMTKKHVNQSERVELVYKHSVRRETGRDQGVKVPDH